MIVQSELFVYGNNGNDGVVRNPDFSANGEIDVSPDYWNHGCYLNTVDINVEYIPDTSDYSCHIKSLNQISQLVDVSSSVEYVLSFRLYIKEYSVRVSVLNGNSVLASEVFDASGDNVFTVPFTVPSDADSVGICFSGNVDFSDFYVTDVSMSVVS